MDTKTKTPGSALNRWAGYSMLFIAVAHTLVFAFNPFWSQWLSGGLRGGQAPADAYTTFWALPGGFVPVLVLLGILVVRMGRRGEPVPGYFGWVMLAWCGLCTYIVGPSGFVSGIVPAALLIAGTVVAAKAVKPQLVTQ